MIQEFKDFINRGNVLDLAVAVVLGAAFGAVVTSFVDDVLMQVIAAIGFLYVLTLFLGIGAMTSGVINLTDNNMSAPLLALSFGVVLFAIISSIAFATVLGTVSGLIVAASGAVAHDLMDRFLGMQMTDTGHQPPCRYWACQGALVSPRQYCSRRSASSAAAASTRPAFTRIRVAATLRSSPSVAANAVSAAGSP